MFDLAGAGAGEGAVAELDEPTDDVDCERTPRPGSISNMLRGGRECESECAQSAATGIWETHRT